MAALKKRVTKTFQISQTTDDVVGGFRIVYRREGNIGDVSNIEVGDTIRFTDNNKAQSYARVQKVACGRVKTEVVKKYGAIMKPMYRLSFDEILEVKRKAEEIDDGTTD